MESDQLELFEPDIDQLLDLFTKHLKMAKAYEGKAMESLNLGYLGAHIHFKSLAAIAMDMVNTCECSLMFYELAELD